MAAGVEHNGLSLGNSNGIFFVGTKSAIVRFDKAYGEMNYVFEGF